MSKSPIISWSDLPTPVLVKEVRQLTRSRLLLAVIWIELFGLAFFTSATLMWNLWQADVSDAGLSFFLCLVQILAAALACGSLDTMLRTLAERSESADDLMYVSSLSSAQILRGKFWAGLSVNLLILSLGLPFLALSYLLRGISLPTLAWGSFYLLALSVLLVPLVQVIALLPVPVLLKKYGAGLGLVAGVVCLGVPVCELFQEMAGHFGGRELLCWLVLLGSLLLLLNSAARFFLTRMSVDRSWRPRLLMLGLAVVWLALVIGGSIGAGSHLMTGYGSSASTFVLIALSGMVLVHVLPLLAVMLALQCPVVMATAWRRPKWISAKWCFPLLDGTWNGMMIAAALAGMAMVCALFILSFFVMDIGLSWLFVYLAGAPIFFGYLLCYAMTARFIGDWLRRRRHTAITALHVFIIMLIAAGLATGVAVAGGLDWALAGDVFAFCYPNQVDSDKLMVHAFTVLVWGLPLRHWAHRPRIRSDEIISSVQPPRQSVFGLPFSFSDIAGIWQDWRSDSPVRRMVPEWVLRTAGRISPLLTRPLRPPAFLFIWLADGNPILVKELRQMGRSRFQAIVLWLEIAMLAVAALCGLVEIFNGRSGLYGNDNEALPWIPMILTLALLAVSLEQMNRTASESDSTAADLLFITTLTPDQIILGKFGAALIPVTLMLLSAGPFLFVLDWILSMPWILACLTFVFVIAMGVLLAAVAVVLAMMPVPLTVKRYVFGPLLGAAVVGVTSVFGNRFYNTDGPGAGITILNGCLDMASWLFLLALAAAVLLAFARFLTASAVSPRSRHLRIQLLTAGLVWVAAGILFALRWRWTQQGTDIIIVSTAGFFLLALPVLFAGLLCPRPLAVPPAGASRRQRFFEFPFLEGSANGFVLAALLAMLAASSIHLWGMAGRGIVGLRCTMGKASSISCLCSFHREDPYPMVFTPGNSLAIGLSLIGFGYLFCYALSSRLAGDWLRRRKEENPLFKPSILLLVALFIAALSSTLTTIMASGFGSDQDWLLPANVFAWLWPVQGGDWLTWHAAIIAVWLGLCLWAARRWRPECPAP
jgi:hypothetical protein